MSLLTLGNKKQENADKVKETSARNPLPMPKKGILKKSKEELQRIREAELQKERENKEKNNYNPQDVKLLYELVRSSESENSKDSLAQIKLNIEAVVTRLKNGGADLKKLVEHIGILKNKELNQKPRGGKTINGQKFIRKPPIKIKSDIIPSMSKPPFAEGFSSLLPNPETLGELNKSFNNNNNNNNNSNANNNSSNSTNSNLNINAGLFSANSNPGSGTNFQIKEGLAGPGTKGPIMSQSNNMKPQGMGIYNQGYEAGMQYGSSGVNANNNQNQSGRQFSNTPKLNNYTEGFDNPLKEGDLGRETKDNNSQLPLGLDQNMKIFPNSFKNNTSNSQPSSSNHNNYQKPYSSMNNETYFPSMHGNMGFMGPPMGFPQNPNYPPGNNMPYNNMNPMYQGGMGKAPSGNMNPNANSIGKYPNTNNPTMGSHNNGNPSNSTFINSNNSNSNMVNNNINSSNNNNNNNNNNNMHQPRGPHRFIQGVPFYPGNVGSGGYGPNNNNNNPDKDPSKKNKYRTVPCKGYHSSQGCKRGDGCHFIHDKNHAGVEPPKGLYPSQNQSNFPASSVNPPPLISGGPLTHINQNKDSIDSPMPPVGAFGPPVYSYGPPYNQQMMNPLNQPLKSFTQRGFPVPGGDHFRKKFPVPNPRPLAAQPDAKDRLEEERADN